MGRGRRHAPPTSKIGEWFRHRGAQSAGPPAREHATSTGDMLAAPFRCSSEELPGPPPLPFKNKASRNYRVTNRFSEHDNRNAFQDHGVYFGDGQSSRQLGRNLIDPHLRLHNTDKHFLKHFGNTSIDFDYHSTYQKSYKGKDTPFPPSHRRFQKSLPPTQQGRVPLTTGVTDWLPEQSAQNKTHTQVLAVSQEPFLKHNPWKYSFNSTKNVYPPYERHSEPNPENTLNRYGPAFTNAVDYSNFSGVSSLRSADCSV